MSIERSRNEEAYKRLRSSLEQEYRGQFAAIAHGELVAVGASLEEVTSQAEAAAPEATHRLIFKVGEKYPSLVTVGAPQIPG